MDELEMIRKKKMKEMMEKMMQDEKKPETKPKLNYPVNLNSSNFEKILKENKYVVVDFWAEWCAPCKLIAPVIDELARNYEDVVFGKVNTSEEQGIANKFGITAIPTLIFFRNGKPVDKVVGALPKTEIIRWIRKNMV